MTEIDVERELRQVLTRTAAQVSGEGVRRDAVERTVAGRRRARRIVRVAGTAAAAAAVVATLFIFVGPEGDRVDTVPGGSSTSAPTSAPTPTPSPSEDEDTSRTTTSSSTSTSSGTSSTTTSSAALPTFPAALTTDLAQGDAVWAVYLAVAAPGASDAPELQAADAARAAAGYSSGGGFSNLACDEGAVEALGREGDSLTSALYFATEAGADQARRAFEARGQSIVGVVPVTVYCLD